ncbi:AlbA family DNA-binding domain-containing protein [Mycobacterium sp. Marseille-P9652]|uniref:AlbA family DNA-binding domain-containing protein n=1 Tax=Mycobacterium sp. Marseille-P9652 TaxID=2654950 RepID=UPI001E3F4801|nr:ATP-binding protein [Mycobacterium sp. Marseille-P9652]
MTNSEPWPPRTEEQIAHAAANGLLEETHYLDIKRELATGPRANRDIAKDIAAFALDGGVIVIGVDEVTSPPKLHPIDVANLGERIESIAASSVHEAVTVYTHVVESSTPGLGYLVVEIPPSPRAPHMADGRYYGRGDKRNRPLPHEEVLRLHEQQARLDQDIVAESQETLDLLKRQYQFHSEPLLIRAKPLGARGNFLMQLSDSGSWRDDVRDLVRLAAVGSHQAAVPSLGAPTGAARRDRGVAATVNMFDDKRFGGPQDAAEVTLREDGTITLVSERAVAYPNPGDARILEAVFLGHADLMARLAARVSAYGFRGSWRFAIAANGLHGARSAELRNYFDITDAPPFSESRYGQAATATLKELETIPPMVVSELVGPLLRSIGSAGHFPWVFER